MVRPKRILIMGIGGIGGIISAGLIKAGFAITLITNNEIITENINSHGIQLMKNDKKISFYATAHSRLNELPKKVQYDIVFLTMKANSIEEAVKESLEYIKSDSYIVTFQNGIVEEKVGEIVGPNKVVSAVVGFGGTMHKPGVYEKTSPGDFHIGELNSKKTRRIAELKDILQNVSPVIVTENIRGVLWSKLALNCCINGFAVITGQKLGKMLSRKDIRRMFLKTYQEVVDVAHAQDIELEKVAANPYLLYLPENSGRIMKFVKDLIVRLVGRKYGDVKSSALQSVERGRKTENEFLNGFVVKKGQEIGIDTPMNKKISELVTLIDNNELSMNPKNIELLKNSFDGY